MKFLVTKKSCTLFLPHLEELRVWEQTVILPSFSCQGVWHLRPQGIQIGASSVEGSTELFFWDSDFGERCLGLCSAWGWIWSPGFLMVAYVLCSFPNHASVIPVYLFVPIYLLTFALTNYSGVAFVIPTSPSPMTRGLRKRKNRNAPPSLQILAL